MSTTLPVVRQTNGLATAALVLGIIAIAGSFIPILNIVSILLAVVAMGLSPFALARSKKARVGAVPAWFGLILAVAALGISIAVNIATERALTTLDENIPEVVASLEAETPAGSVEEQQALSAAQSYVESMPFSRQGLIDQLSSEAGSGFPVGVATSAVDSLTVDWNAEAVEAAESYLDMGGFSRAGLIDQLSSPHGSQFTQQQAEHAVSAVGF